MYIRKIFVLMGCRLNLLHLVGCILTKSSVYNSGCMPMRLCMSWHVKQVNAQMCVKHAGCIACIYTNVAVYPHECIAARVYTSAH